MGCGASKLDSEAVKLCRERKSLVKAARDSWCSLSSTHLAYFESLLGFKNQLNIFIEEAIEISFKSVSDTGLDHQILEEGPGSENSTSESNENEDSDGEDAEDDEVADDCLVSSGLSDVILNSLGPQSENVSRQVWPLVNLPLPLFRSGTSTGYSVYGSAAYATGNLPNHQMIVLPYRFRPSENESLVHLSSQRILEPNIGFFFQEIHETNFGGNGMDLGMPGLEDEFGNPVTEDTLGDEIVELDEGQDAYPDEIEEVRSTSVEADPESNSCSSISGSSAVGDINKFNSCNQEEEPVQMKMWKHENRDIHDVPPESNENAAEFLLEMSGQGSFDLQKVLNEMNDAFADIVTHGDDVSSLFGPLQPGIALIKGFSFCHKFSAASSTVTSGLARGMLRRSTCRILKIRRNIGQSNQNETNTRPCSLSVTLEKLCIWEYKLFKEVKVEEKLRQKFDKEQRRLQKLYDRGAEPSKIDASRLSLERLTPRLTVAISVVDGIAMRAHKIRDEELHSQIFGLIERLHKMWKKLLEGHKKQVCALTKAQVNTEIRCSSSDLSIKATQMLEAEVTKLGKAFFDWTKSHRAFADLLINWLMKFLPNPSSPSMPALLALCKKWGSAVERTSAVQVLQALNNLSLLLHLLRLKLQEEWHQRLKMEYLSSYHEKELKEGCLESCVDWQEYVSIVEADNASSTTSTIESRFSSLHARYLSLRPIRVELREAQSRHNEVMEELKAAAPHLFRQGLIPVFEALQSFSVEMCNAFEQVRMAPNERDRQSP